jgi:hypothetical protein
VLKLEGGGSDLAVLLLLLIAFFRLAAEKGGVIRFLELGSSLAVIDSGGLYGNGSIDSSDATEVVFFCGGTR